MDATQLLPTMLGDVGQQCFVHLHRAKSWTGFKLFIAQQLPTTRNTKEGLQTDATCNIQQCCFRLYGA